MITRGDLAFSMRTGISNINNVLPTLRLLRLIDLKKKSFSLTNEGVMFIRAHNSGEVETAKEIFRNAIERSEALKFVKSFLETRIQVTGQEIGVALSEHFNKKWKTVVSYRTFGNSCASIIGFAGFGLYHRGKLSLKPLTTKEDGICAPEAGFNQIIRMLNALHSFESTRLSDLTEKLKIQGRRIGSDLSVCAKLRLAQKDITGSYNITEVGSKLIDPLLPRTERTRIFRECILNSPYVMVIQKLSQADRELTFEDLGESLSYLLQRNWASSTKKLYGKKFVTWLKAAELLEKTSPDGHRLKISSVKK